MDRHLAIYPTKTAAMQLAAAACPGRGGLDVATVRGNDPALAGRRVL
jgi:hypothetical protein